MPVGGTSATAPVPSAPVAKSAAKPRAAATERVDQTPAALSSGIVAPRADPLARVLERAVQQRAAAPPPAVVIARRYMPTSNEFRTGIGAGALKDDGRLKQLDKRLRRYDALDLKKGTSGNRNQSNDFKRIQTARLIELDAQEWLDSHAQDASPVAAAVRDIQTRAKRDADSLEGKAVRRHGKDADKRLKQYIAAKDMQSAVRILAPVINAVVPTSGSKAEVEAEIELAVDPNMVGFIGLRLKLEADRPDDTKIKARAEATLTGGVKVPQVGRARFEFGGYLEAQGRTADEICQLVSYALYRTAREDRFCPRWIPNMLWGGEWDTDPGYANAERWAGAVETGVMGASDAYVESGLMAGVMAEMGFQAGEVGAKAKAQLQAGVGERWDKKSIATIHQEKSKWSDAKIQAVALTIGANLDADPHDLYAVLAKDGHNVSVARIARIQKKALKRRADGALNARAIESIVRTVSPARVRPNLGEASEFEGTFGAQEARGEHTFWVKGSAEADISIANMAMKAEIAFQSRGRDKVIGTHMREAKLEGRFGVKLPLSKALGSGLLETLEMSRAVDALLNYCRAMNTLADEEKPLAKKDQVSRGIGSGLRAAGDLGSGLSQLKAIGSKKFEWTGEAKSAIDPGVSGFVALGVIIEAKFKTPHSDGSKSSYEVNLSVVEEKGFKFEADLAAVSGRVSAKTQERWLRIQVKDGVRTTDFIGELHVRPAKPTKP